MKTIALLITFFAICFSTLTSTSYAQGVCADLNGKGGGGVDVWPWSVAQPFPWDNIQGFWRLGNDEDSFIRARVLSATNDRKILNISVYGDGVCSKPYATGKGYIDFAEKNVVRAIVSDGVYKYQLKLGLFNFADVISSATSCRRNFMAASMQVIGRAPGQDETEPLDPDITEVQNMMLKKVTVDPTRDCKKN